MISHSSERVRDFLISQIAKNPRDVASVAAEEFGISRQAINHHLRKLVEEGVIVASGATRARQYSLQEKKALRKFQLNEDLAEDRVWREWVRPQLDLVSEKALAISHYGVTEILNNALDHSEGQIVQVGIRQSAAMIETLVFDDGIGIFHKIQRDLGLEDERHAVLELSKGKLTTDPQHHTGEGIFFASRMFDRFVIQSGTLMLCHVSSGDGESDWLLENSEENTGTMVVMTVDPQTKRTTKEVFDRFTSAEDGDYGFDVTHVPVMLAKYGDENLVSRSQAKRLLARFGLFKRVILDFRGVTSIGQAFADEIFRVFRRENPEIELLWAAADQDVEKMILRAVSRED